MKKDIILEKFLESIEILKKIRETNVYINQVIDKFLASLSEETPPLLPKKEEEKSEESSTPKGASKLGTWLKLEEQLKSAAEKKLKEKKELGKKLTPGAGVPIKKAEEHPLSEKFSELMLEIARINAAKEPAEKYGLTTSTESSPISDTPFEISDKTPAERPFKENTGEDAGVGARRAKKEKDGRLYAKSTTGGSGLSVYDGPF